jgi:hypothetical protein
MLLEDKEIPELFNMKHLNDDFVGYVDYENKILNKSLSSYLYNNNLMSYFLNACNKLVSLLFDQHNIIKNWNHFVVDKYYYKHTN